MARGRELFPADRGLQARMVLASGRLQQIPMRDLRAVAGRDAFHLLPVGERGEGSRFTATHPDLELRIRRLEDMERRLQNARLP